MAKKTEIQNQNVPVICEVEITTDAAGRFNLNALHKASGTGKHKAPNKWLETKQAKELIAELEANLLKNIQTPNSGSAQKVINVINGGNSPGTYAHELLAIEYAGWIKAPFRLQVNQTFLDFKAGKLQPTFDPVAALNDPEFLRGTLLGYTEKVIALEHKVEEVSGERDEAIRTKSQISRKREASALGKLSAAQRRCRDLEEQLGESTKHATIIKVEKATGRKDEFSYIPLRRWCKDNGVEAKSVPDERYGSVKSWPAGAWLDVYGIDLKSLFGDKK
ncbi:KilA-N domain-containing protein [Salmonella enterica]|nr:KilA-N domain-containing protein [Salmonella enterica]EEP9538068.1 KilA-N domain-containing protein [Salmonella enterica]EFP3676700.1 KilA-N domain-containing protein [Salmonella enterica]